jgi:N-acetylglucosamine-6-phosphate deacetylase
MRPLHHRDPGPIAALLAAASRGDAVVELVGDGVHLDPETVRAVVDLAARADGVMLVTDAMAAAGMPDGAYRLGTADVVVDRGVARLASDGAIAGGTSHLLDQLRLTAAAGIPLVTATRMASLVPAEVLGRHDVGRLTPGARADVLVADDELRPLAVIRAGEIVSGRLP